MLVWNVGLFLQFYDTNVFVSWERPICRILQEVLCREKLFCLLHKTECMATYMSNLRGFILSMIHVMSEDLSFWLMTVVSDGDGSRTAGVAGQGWVEVGFGTGGCGWMTDDVDRVREVWDGLCYQLSRLQACLCDVCAVTPYFIALFLSVLHLWSTTHAAEMGFDPPSLLLPSLFFFWSHSLFSFFDSHPLAFSLQHREN